MYIIDNFVYGHDFSKNKRINNNLVDMDGWFEKTIDGIKYEVSFPYHGGQVAGDTLSIIFGCNITDNDRNPSYIDTIRNAKEEDYKDSYKKFVDIFISHLTDTKKEAKPDKYWSAKDIEEWKKEVDEIIHFLKANEPEFYSVESSS